MSINLVAAFQSPALGWLTTAFLFTASITTYLKRIDQYKKAGALPPSAPSLKKWGGLFFWIEIILKVWLVILNWQFGILVYVLGFVLGVLGVLENVGYLLLHPLVGTEIPPLMIDPDEPFPMLLQREKRVFIIKMLLAAGAYVGITLVLNAVRKEATTGLLWGSIFLQLLFYGYIFFVAAVRASECGYKVSCWLAPVLAVLGRVEDFEVVVIPAVILASFAISAKGRTLDASAEGGPVPD